MKLGKKVTEILKTGEFSPHKPRVLLTSGDAIRIYREAHGFTQAELGKRAGMPQHTISALENNRATLGLDRAKALARALKVHPAVLAFPSWNIEAESDDSEAVA